MTRSNPNPPTPDPTSVHLSGEVSMPEEIGGYAIHRVLGAGGMAIVYAAQQQRPKRVVALKVMKTGGDARRALHRFRREIEILGKLRHPYIAQVYDAGTHVEGSAEWPYYVMEYVPGAKDILVYAHLKDLDIRDRLKLFVRVCAAVEHGHRAHVIHRDLKPGNILIDNLGEPKIIDFGVARAMETEIGATTLATEEGRLVGTIQYMAPEQLEAKVQDVDARIDVYALGALLYRLVTGRLPHELDGLTLYTAIQVLREEAPPRPSELNPEIKGDLETIILKSIEKDRTRRYRTAGSLGRDLVRYLADKPIHARPASIGYRMRLFIKRNRAALAAVLAIVIVLTVAGGLVAYERWRPRESPELDQTRTELEAERAARAAAEAALSRGVDAGDGSSPDADREPIVLSGHGGSVTSLAYSGNGSLLFAASDDRTVSIWDTETQQQIDALDDHDVPISRIAAAADSPRIASADRNGVIAVNDANAQELVEIIRTECRSNTCLAIAGDGNLLAFGCEDLALRIRSLNTGATLIVRGTTGAFTAAAFSPDGRSVVAGSARGTVYVADAATGEISLRLEGLDEEVLLVGHVGEDGNRIVALDRSGRGAIWDLSRAEAENRRSRFLLANARLTQAALDPTGRILAGAADDMLYLFDVANLQSISLPDQRERLINSIAITPTLDAYAVGDAIGEVTIVPMPE